eukprot:Lithocolla_globosa_v1_NODE_3873_length_1560_cov_4.273754.p2 type:complete len:142 gc:universal NODE_3873_length_1560_cov_4.273754:798-373(-)
MDAEPQLGVFGCHEIVQRLHTCEPIIERILEARTLICSFQIFKFVFFDIDSVLFRNGLLLEPLHVHPQAVKYLHPLCVERELCSIELCKVVHQMHLFVHFCLLNLEQVFTRIEIDSVFGFVNVLQNPLSFLLVNAFVVLLK